MHVTKVTESSVHITGVVIGHPHLHEARAVKEGQDPKFSAVIILPKTLDQADWDILNGMVATIAAKKWPQGVPASFKSPFRDAGEIIDQYAGHYAMNCSARLDSPPEVVKEDGATRAAPGECYGGCGVNVYLGAYPYDTLGNKGVAFGLNAVQITDRTLPRIDGRKSARQVFTAVAAPAAGPGVQQQPQPAAGPNTQQQPVGGAPPAIDPAPHQPAPAAPVQQQPVPVGAPTPGGGPGPAI